jgi:hypothetical protein
MVQSQNTRVSDRQTGAARTKSTTQPLYAFEVLGDAAKVLSELDLPQGASVVIISSDRAVEAKLRTLAPGRLARYGEIQRGGGVAATSEKRGARPSSVDKSAFEPDDHARAVLRGLERAREDLRDAGGAYDLDQARAVLNGVSRQAIGKRVKEGSLLALPGPNGHRTYPTLQFTGDGTVVEGLRAVREALPSRSPWLVLNFLANPQTVLDGRKPIDLLKAGKVASVVEAARRFAVQGG